LNFKIESTVLKFVKTLEFQEILKFLKLASFQSMVARICPAPCKLTLKVMSETRDVGYLCANSSLPRLLCSRLLYATDVRSTRVISLNAPYPRGG